MNDTRKQCIVVFALVTSVAALAARRTAQPASGLQQTPDSARYLISKDVGAERWAISYNLNDKTVTGNVFKTDGSAPSFIWCQITDVAESHDPGRRQVHARLLRRGRVHRGAVHAVAVDDDRDGPRDRRRLPAADRDRSRPTAATCSRSSTQSCAFSGCHGGANPDAGLNLEASVSYDAIFLQRLSPGAPYLVEPFAPDSSSLLESMVRSGDGIMPPGGKLPDDQIDAIRTWILEGAARN